MARLAAGLGLAVLLAACGSGSAPDGGAAAKDEATAPAPELSGGGSAECTAKPDFAPVYADARISLCTAGHVEATSRDSGTISYASAASPRTVLVWSKQQVTGAGLAERIANDTMLSAGDGDRRTVMVMAVADGSGSKVTVNWGRAR